MTLVILDISSAQIVCGTPLSAAKNTADPTARQSTKWDKKVKRGISTVLHWSPPVATPSNHCSSQARLVYGRPAQAVSLARQGFAKFPKAAGTCAYCAILHVNSPRRCRRERARERRLRRSRHRTPPSEPQEPPAVSALFPP